MKTRCVVLVALVTAACGEEATQGPLPDAPVPTVDARAIDSAPDIDAAPPIDRPPPGVTVTVTVGGVPSPGQLVYFQSHDSPTMVGAITDTDGVATGMVQAGDFVTVIDPLSPVEIGGPVHLSTFAGVRPGDHLLRDVPVPVTQGDSIRLTITIPDEQQGYDYVLYSTCGSTPIARGSAPTARARGATRSVSAAPPLTALVQLFGCDDTEDLLVVGSDSEGRPHSWQYRPNVALTPGRMVTIESYEPIADQTYAYTALAGTSQVAVTRELRTGQGTLYSVSTHVAVEGTAGSIRLPMPTPAGVVAVTTSTDVVPSSVSQATVIDWGANTDYALDFAAADLHDYRAAPGFDVASHAVQWTSAAEGQIPALTISSLHVQRIDAGGPHVWTWDLVAPWTEGALAYPVLPTTRFDFNPGATDEVAVERLTTAKVPGGYDAVRRRVFAGDLKARVVGASGQIVLQDLVANPGRPAP
jgi:hypothetical protein